MEVRTAVSTYAVVDTLVELSLMACVVAVCAAFNVTSGNVVDHEGTPPAELTRIELFAAATTAQVFAEAAYSMEFTANW